MENISAIIKKNIPKEAKATSIAIIKGVSRVVYSTENWDISTDLTNVNTIWDELSHQDAEKQKFLEQISEQQLKIQKLRQPLLDAQQKLKELQYEQQILKEQDIKEQPLKLHQKGQEIKNQESILQEIEKQLEEIKLEEMRLQLREMKKEKQQKFVHEKKVIMGKEHNILQCTDKRLVASSVDKKESFIGLKDGQYKIFCRIESVELEEVGNGLMGAARALKELRTEKPYMEPETSLGKINELKWTIPKVLPHDTLNLHNFGVLKFGLSEDDAEVYLALFKKGELGETIGNLHKEILRLKRTHVYRIIERLEKNGWVKKELDIKEKVQRYKAIPFYAVLDDFIKEKEKELKVLRSFRSILTDEWPNVSEKEHDQPDNKYDFNSLAITGEEKDCGMLIFDYGNLINDEGVINAALESSCMKLMQNLQKDPRDPDREEFYNEDLEDRKIDETTFQNYLGATMSVKFRKGSKTANSVGNDWIVVANLVAVPVENKIYVIWGSKEKFPLLLNTILDMSEFKK